MTACVAHLRLHEARLRACNDDALAVHQMRVAMRRLRSALSLFKPIVQKASAKRIDAELRWCAKQFAGARNLDVFVTETLTPLQASLPRERCLGTLAKRTEKARRGAYGRALRAIDTRRYARMLSDLEQWIEAGDFRDPERPARETGAEILARIDQKVRAAAANLPSHDRHALHALRIRVKRLRLSAEALGSLFDVERSRPVIAHLRKLQDLLGHIQDVAVTDALLKRVVPAAKRTPALTRAIGIVTGWQTAAEQRTRSRLAKRWTKFERHANFWA